MTSLSSLFPTTRGILREAGPRIGAKRGSVGGIAIEVLNRGLRPFLSKWHPQLEEWEASRVATTSSREHEKDWPDQQEFRRELKQLSAEMDQYADSLRVIAGVVRDVFEGVGREFP